MRLGKSIMSHSSIIVSHFSSVSFYTELRHSKPLRDRSFFFSQWKKSFPRTCHHSLSWLYSLFCFQFYLSLSLSVCSSSFVRVTQSLWSGEGSLTIEGEEIKRREGEPIKRERETAKAIAQQLRESKHSRRGKKKNERSQRFTYTRYQCV